MQKTTFLKAFVEKDGFLQPLKSRNFNVVVKTKYIQDITVCQKRFFCSKTANSRKAWKMVNFLFLCQNTGKNIDIFEFSRLNWSKIVISWFSLGNF